MWCTGVFKYLKEVKLNWIDGVSVDCEILIKTGKIV